MAGNTVVGETVIVAERCPLTLYCALRFAFALRPALRRR